MLAKSRDNNFTIPSLCNTFGISKQSYYQHRNKKANKKSNEQVLLDKVKEIRATQPRIGTRKLLYIIQNKSDYEKHKIGRDRFFRLLGENKLLIMPRKKYTYHPHIEDFSVPNIIKDVNITRINQVFASDLTYIKTSHGFLYLFLVSDAYSRLIVGYELSENTSSLSAVKALKMALRKAPNVKNIIHHSDHGGQYSSHLYHAIMLENKLQMSMSAKGNPYENAIAERINGILKNEFILDADLKNLNLGRRFIDEAIRIYNNERPHLSLNFKTPSEVYYRADTTKVDNNVFIIAK